MIGSILSGIGALGSAVYGAISSSKANKKAEKLLKEQKEENKRWYDVKMASDYTKRADVQRAFEKQRELLDEQYEKAKKSQVVTGATDESVAMQKEAANKSVADATAAVAAEGADYKDRVEQQYRQQEAQIKQQEIANQQQKAANTAAAASQAVNAGLNLMGNMIGDKGTEVSPSESAAPENITEHNKAAADAHMASAQAAASQAAVTAKKNTPGGKAVIEQVPTPAGVVKSAEQMAKERAKNKSNA